MLSRRFAVTLASSWLLSSSPAAAQEAVPKEVTAEKALATPKPDVPDGWTLKLTLGGTGSYGHSTNVVGSVDGATIQLGLLITSGASFKHGRSSWENAFRFNETQTRTPQIDSFIKSTDELALESTYLYHLPNIDWFGPFARAFGSTAAFRSYDVRPEAFNVVRTYRDGRPDTAEVIGGGDRIPLTQAFEPLLLKESVGAFAHPINEERFTVKAKLGVGLQHVLVGDGFTVAGSKDDLGTPQPDLQLKQLSDSTQGGGEAEIEILGALTKDVSWRAKASVFYPFYTSVQTELRGADLLSTDVSGKISARLAKWVSLDYVLSIKRIPLILPTWQVQNNVLLTAGFDVI